MLKKISTQHNDPSEGKWTLERFWQNGSVENQDQTNLVAVGVDT